MRPSDAVRDVLERAGISATKRDSGVMHVGHVLLAMLDDLGAMPCLASHGLSASMLRAELDGVLSASASPYRRAKPPVLDCEAVLAELARTLPWAKRIGLFEVTPDDLHRYVLGAVELRRIVDESRFDTSIVDRFAKGASRVARERGSSLVLVEHALLHAFEYEEIRTSLRGAGFQVDRIAKNLEAESEGASDAVVTPQKLRELAIAVANLHNLPSLSLTLTVAELLRGKPLRIALAAAGTDAHELLLCLVHGERAHIDPLGAVKPELVFHDDGMSTMAHVVSILEGDLDLPQHAAIEVMLAIHEKGSMVLDVGDRDPRALARRIRSRSKNEGMPLRVELVPVKPRGSP